MSVRTELAAMLQRLSARRKGAQRRYVDDRPEILVPVPATPDPEQQRRDKEQRDAKKALGIILDRTLALSGRSVELKLGGDEVVFEFRTPDGKTASGKINSRIRQALLRLLSQNTGQASCFELPSGERLETVRVQRIGISDCFKLQLTAEVEEVQPRTETQAQVIPMPMERMPASAAQPAQSDGQGLVLIVDDNMTFAKVLEKFMARQGLVARHVENGRLALELLASGQISPEIVICDVHMPEMNGADFIKSVRADGRFEDLACIMLTSDDDVETEIRLLSVGADVFLKKNQDPRVFCAHVERIISKKRKREAA